jgi:WD repeat-containing protein 19
VREIQLASCAELVAEYCRKQSNIGGAVEFLLLANNDEEAFSLAAQHDEMEIYETGLGEKGTDAQHLAVAKYYEQRQLPARAAKHYALCEEYAIALKLYLKVGEKEIDNAIDVVGRARIDALTHILIDYLMGETDNVPKDPNYIYRLHKALGNFMQAAGTALIIAKQEQEMGSYKVAHGLLFRTFQDLKGQKLTLPLELWQRLSVLHSYILVKRLAKQGNHVNAALVLLRVAKNIQQFPSHVVPILTSCVIECQKAHMKREAYQYACTLVKPEYRPQIGEAYKKKIENTVRKPVKDEDAVDVEQSSPCPYCSSPLLESKLDCDTCKNIIPFCILTGMHMLKDDWSFCPRCQFPARLSSMTELAKAGEHCPMCEEIVKLNEVPQVSDSAPYLADYRALFQAADQETRTA